MKTKWNLKLLYKNPSDPKIERDVRAAERAYDKFAKRYKAKKDYLLSESKLLNALRDYEKLFTTGEKPVHYFWYTRELNATDQRADANLKKLEMRLTKAANNIIFFGLALGRISKAKQKLFLESKKLKSYHYFLECIFETSKYDLSEKEERIMSLKSMPSSGLWISGVEKLLARQEIIFKGKTLPISEASNKIRDLPTRDRRQLNNLVMQKLRSISDFPESEINAVFTNKKINDELRGFKHPYSSTILSYENDESSVMSLVKTVTSRFDLSRRFYKIKARLLGMSHLEYADRSASIGKTKREIPFPEAVKTVRNVFSELGDTYVKIFDRFLDNGQIDVFPHKDKSGGAYCTGAIGLPTFVLLNHISDFNSVKTLAHEMGHAIHTERSKEQHAIYQHYTTSVAETASTFFETAVFEHVFDTLPEKEKVIALHDKIQDDTNTVFRQIAFFNFELELHHSIRKEGSMPKEAIAAMLNKHMRAYCGPIMKFKKDDGFFFVSVSHFRRPFYVYSYAYGQLISKVLYQRYKKEPRYIKKIDAFLTAGGSRSPKNIFKSIGIDTTKKGFFEKGLESIESDVERLEKLVKK